MNSAIEKKINEIRFTLFKIDIMSQIGFLVFLFERASKKNEEIFFFSHLFLKILRRALKVLQVWFMRFSTFEIRVEFDKINHIWKKIWIHNKEIEIKTIFFKIFLYKIFIKFFQNPFFLKKNYFFYILFLYPLLGI